MNTEFFLVGLPGLEDLIQDELLEWYPDLTPTASHGGVSVTVPLSVGLGFNRTLKLPTRVLLRAAKFRCRDFPKLFQTVSAIKWRHWIDLDAVPTVHASTRGSRLKIKTRIEETCVDAWIAARKKAKVEASTRKVDLYVRVHDDECVVSIDSSGERLHKRGVRQFVGEAPLRETIAAALVRMVGRHAKAPPTEIVDPMTGAGTFLLEAAAAHTISNQRYFVEFRTEPQIPAAREVTKPKRLVGLERDAAALKAARENLRGIAHVELIAADVMKAEPLEPAEGPRWLFVNPPYGERLKVEGPLPEYYAKVFAAAERWARPDFACALLPSAGAKGKLALPIGWKVLEKRPFVNGGIPVTAFVFGRSK